MAHDFIVPGRDSSRPQHLDRTPKLTRVRQAAVTAIDNRSITKYTFKASCETPLEHSDLGRIRDSNRRVRELCPNLRSVPAYPRHSLGQLPALSGRRRIASGRTSACISRPGAVQGEGKRIDPRRTQRRIVCLVYRGHSLHGETDPIGSKRPAGWPACAVFHALGHRR